MNKFIRFGVIVILLVGVSEFSAQAFPFFRKNKKNKADTTVVAQPKKAVSKYDKMFVKDRSCQTAKGGFITLHKVGHKVYAELPEKYLGRDVLIATTISEISDSELGTVGYKPQSPLYARFAVIDTMVCLMGATVMPDFDDTDTAMADAMRRNNIDPVLFSFKKTCMSPDSAAVVFDITPMFLNEIPDLSPIKNGTQNMVSTKAQYQASKSSVAEIKSFEDNATVKSMLSFNVTSSVLGLVTLKNDQPVTVKATRTILLLPEKPAKARLADSRVGIFLSNRTCFAADSDMSDTYSVIHRWNLIPSDSAAFARGEKVEPVKPIIFYIDDAFPERLKDAAKEGIERWNAAFERIGFRNAVQVRDFPKDDADFDPDNLKYSCIRYVPSPTANAMGPSWVDPRSGEIINASVIVYSDVLKLLNSWRFCQTAQIDERVRAIRMPDEVMRESLAYVLSHEVGHCLGFMHNMAASAAFAVDSLRNAAFTERYGTTPSIMDYARFNYVAQPTDRGVRLTPPDLGVYDYFLVKYAYAPIPEAATAKDEAPVLESWVHEVAGDKRFRYGRQQVRYRYDPSAIEEDLGDDPVKAADYGIANLKYILSNLNGWITDADDPTGKQRERLYGDIVKQYNRYVGAVMLNIGGIYLTSTDAATADQSAVAVPEKRQREALAWVMRAIDDCEWLDEESVMRKLPLMVGRSSVVAYNNTLDLLDTYKNVMLSSYIAPETDRFTADEWFDEVYKWIWKSTTSGKEPSAADRNKQKLFVAMCAKEMSKAPIYISASLSSLTDRAFLPSVNQMEWFNLDESGTLDRHFDRLQQIEFDKGSGYIASLLPTEQAFGPAGYGWQAKINIKTIDESYSALYGQAEKAVALLKRASKSAPASVRPHYSALLHILENAMEAK